MLALGPGHKDTAAHPRQAGDREEHLSWWATSCCTQRPATTCPPSPPRLPSASRSLLESRRHVVTVAIAIVPSSLPHSVLHRTQSPVAKVVEIGVSTRPA